MYVRTPVVGLGATASTGAILAGAGISAGVSLATSAAGMWLNSINQSHQAMTATTQIVNGLEPLLRANKDAYLAGPGTCADQAAALAAFDSAWQWLISPKGCGSGIFGSAGNACISDRGPGGKFPWFTWYRDPIANDPRAAGCAAALAASNPDAALQSALANINLLTSGSTQQTNPGMFAGSSSGTSSAGTSGDLLSGGSIADAASGIPSWVWLAAAGLAVFLVVK